MTLPVLSVLVLLSVLAPTVSAAPRPAKPEIVVPRSFDDASWDQLLSGETLVACGADDVLERVTADAVDPQLKTGSADFQLYVLELDRAAQGTSQHTTVWRACFGDVRGTSGVPKLRGYGNYHNATVGMFNLVSVRIEMRYSAIQPVFVRVALAVLPVALWCRSLRASWDAADGGSASGSLCALCVNGREPDACGCGLCSASVGVALCNTQVTRQRYAGRERGSGESYNVHYQLARALLTSQTKNKIL